MKNTVLRATLAVVAIIALVICSFGVSSAQQKKKGPALQQLEEAAGKKIEDVKVPAVPAPTPVKTNEVQKSTSTTSSFDVNTSTSTPKKK
ncbi:MAG: hypothetical protein A4E61_00655 [Syntrophorhabdus sp. PtaB.Bin184]|jgi:hypothetical protein|nr:MAG: hypothetical protein A4E61_00655 [Syntrophorhabdus sp. PtaB.Bin184]